jgi:GTPase
MFVDNVEIKVLAGNGGSGLASFRREKFLPFGGPDGGDGGKGGDVYFLADSNMEDLNSFKHKLVFKAKNGGKGGPNDMHGLNAGSLVIKVPVGTSIYLKEDGKELLTADLQTDGQKVMLAKGGKGGKGNVHFATATRKAPVIFQPGEPGEQHELTLRVRLPVDVCIIGYPNSGKSTLLASLSAAKPVIAEYPYTTREPVLGIVDDGVRKYTWAELPALAKNVHGGKGAGGKYLGQAARASVILYLLDASSQEPLKDLERLQSDVALSDEDIAGKKAVIAVNKIDLLEDAASLETLKETLMGSALPVFIITAKEKQGLGEMVACIHQLVMEEKQKEAGELQPEVVFRPKPVDKRV